MAVLAATILLAVASPVPFTVYGDRTVAGFPLTGSPARARAFFSPPQQTHARRPYECIQSWGLFRLAIACKETGGAAYGSLVARVLRGRVSALVVSGALCE